MSAEKAAPAPDLHDQAGEIAGLVEYAEGAVVSRALRSGKSGSITLFAFDSGQELSEHTTPCDAFVQVLDGRGEFTVAGRKHEVRAGQGLLMPASVPHAVRAVERFKMLLTMFRP